MQRKTAELIASAVRTSAVALTELLPVLKMDLDEREFKAYKREIARLLTMMDVELIQRFAEAHPDVDAWGKRSESDGQT